MKKVKGLKSSVFGMLTALAVLLMIILLNQVPARAGGDPCANFSKTADSDGDGFTDFAECNGIQYAISGSISGSNSTQARANRLDPKSKDLFVIMAPAAGGYFDRLGTNRLEYIYNSQNLQGLGITTHELTFNPQQAGADRTVCKNITKYPCTPPTGQTMLQKAVKVTEILDDGGTGANRNILASSSSMHGTPNGTDLCIIYTVRIKNSIQEKCGCADILTTSCANCRDNTGVSGTNLFYKYIKHTIAHEIGHQIMLKTVSDPQWGWHYPEDTGVDLDYQVHFDATGFHLGTTFTSADYSAATLK